MKSIEREDCLLTRDEHRNPRLSPKNYQQSQIREIVQNLPDQSLISTLVRKYINIPPPSKR